ncbi:MAG TPA: choice-of-anchor tandem repeat GloVer-containing protein [Candidatus Sulfotelmatobacter sp.]|nr:choice-of-anchor tandem repeat GloVer-containing protein [Candidatus Sulfotelmatobacter sp.]
MTTRQFCDRLMLLAVLALASTLLHAQTYTVLHNFNETEGCCSNYPGMMAQGRDGNIYGATTGGGTHLYGNIFKMTPSGTLTSIYSFDPTNGAYPQGGISLGQDGNFYGTTYQGGAHSRGTIFKVTPAGVHTVLYSFSDTGDGAYPKTPPVQAQDGNLYGTTGNGSQYVLYQVTTSGTFTIAATILSQSYSPLLLGIDGNLYGTTLANGTYNGGTVFQFSPSLKTVKTIFNFHNEWSPTGPLMQGVDGALYGTTSSGGTGDGGVVFRLTTAGVYKILHTFSTTGATDGRFAYSGVVQGSDKFLYGVASVDGPGGFGTLFKVSTTGTGFAVVHSFAVATGDTPLTAFLAHTNGKLYGQTSHGGTHTPYGVVYSLDAGLSPFVNPVVLHSAKVGGTVEILGQGFTTATGVSFGTGTSTFTAVSSTYMTAKPVAGALTGQITVQEPSGNLLTPLKFKIVPSITSFTPTSGTVGTQVVITGMSLMGATAVKFGAIAATVFTVDSNTQATATVPNGAVTGKIQIVTPGGVATSATNFTVN